MFQTKVEEEFKSILCSIFFFSRKSYPLWNNVEKYRRAERHRRQ